MEVSPAVTPAKRRYLLFAWFTLAYTVAVILFGAWVRITGSGAGCGQHWPTCHGEVAHRPEAIETAIELTHRVTSAADGLLVIGLVIGACLVTPRRHPARWAALASLVFVITEGLVGALLVKAELVENDASIMRAVVMSIHLVNTSLLTGAMALSAFFASPAAPERTEVPSRAVRVAGWMLAAGLLATLLIMMAGAVTALGDTLFPVHGELSKAEVIAQDHAVSAHFLQRMRIVHPLGSVAVGLYLFYLAVGVSERIPGATVTRWSRATIVLVVAQLGAGVVNIALSAPGWMQLVHLGLATLLWIVLVLLAAAAYQSSR